MSQLTSGSSPVTEVVRLEDYAPPPYLIDSVHLDVDVQAAGQRHRIGENQRTRSQHRRHDGIARR